MRSLARHGRGTAAFLAMEPDKGRRVDRGDARDSCADCRAGNPGIDATERPDPANPPLTAEIGAGGGAKFRRGAARGRTGGGGNETRGRGDRVVGLPILPRRVVARSSRLLLPRLPEQL